MSFRDLVLQRLLVMSEKYGEHHSPIHYFKQAHKWALDAWQEADRWLEPKPSVKKQADSVLEAQKLKEKKSEASHRSV